MRLPIGVSDFGKLVGDEDALAPFLFVDKILFVRDIMWDVAEVLLFTRPRRFGKTLSLSMLHHFFSEEVMGRKTAPLFAGMKISQDAQIMRHQGQYPVIFFSLISDLYKTHRYLLSSTTLYGVTVYNPWTILKCIKSEGQLASYWVNTNGNALVAKMLVESGGGIKEDFDALLRGESIRGLINSNLIFADLRNNPTVVLTILLMSGCLKVTKLIKNIAGEYHGFTLGLLAALQDDYIITSNHEADFGRYDIALIPRDSSQNKRAILFEFKSVPEGDIDALKQAYANELAKHTLDEILTIGVAFSDKAIELTYKKTP